MVRTVLWRQSTFMGESLTETTSYRSEITKIFRATMKRHGITKSLLENDELRHVFAVSYRTYRHSICLGGDLYCAELWNLVGKSDLEKSD